MPLWCALLIAAAWGPMRRHDDSMFYAAILLPLTCAIICSIRRAWVLAIYTFGVSIAFGILGVVVVPAMNVAR